MSRDDFSFQALPEPRRWLVYLTVVLMPLSVDVHHLVGAKFRTYFSPLDVLLPALFVWLLVDLLLHREKLRAKVPPVPMLLWAALGLASWLWTASFPNPDPLKAWLKGPFFFGIAAVWVFENAAFSAAEFRRLALLLGASVSVCLLLALKQYSGPEGLPFDPENPKALLGGATAVRVAGWYDFRAVFGSQMALLAPVAVAFALLEQDSLIRWAAGAFAAIALCVTLSAGGFLGACAGIVAVAVVYALQRGWLTGLTVLAVLLFIVAAIVPQLPRHNLDVLKRNTAFFALDNGEMKATARLRRYQAELNLLSARPLGAETAPFWQKGVGLGKFQRIDQFYDDGYGVYPKPSFRTNDEAAFDMNADEPFSFSLFETVAVELGVAGLLVTLLIFGTWIFSAHQAFTASAPEELHRATLALAALGAGCGALVLSVFANPMVRGVGGTFAFFFALAVVLARRPARRGGA